MENTKSIAKYIGLDGWSRPVFQTEHLRNYYCLVELPDDLEHLKALVAQANATPGLIYCKGSDPDGEPGWPIESVTLVLEPRGE